MRNLALRCTRRLSTRLDSKQKFEDVLPLFTEVSFLRGTDRLLDSFVAHCHPQNDLDQRQPKDSYISLIMPFSSNTRLQDEYTLFGGKGMRIGKVLEDLDAFAADVAFRHCRGSEQDMNVVTACLDRLPFFDRLDMKHDLRMEGRVSWVGKSSMEVCVDLSAVECTDGECKNINWLGQALFLMVARHPQEETAVKVPRLHAKTEEEKELGERGRRNNERRKELWNVSLRRMPPTADESYLLHNLFNKSQTEDFRTLSQLPVDFEYMENAKCQTTVCMHAQDRNRHSKIFGGHLMRVAYETAWANARMFSGRFPMHRSVDDMDFLKPVEIGSIVEFDSSVVYSDPSTNTVHVGVQANVQEPEHHRSYTTNTFHFSFRVDPGKRSPPLKQLMPRSYKESLLLLDGRRRAHCYRP